FAQSKTCRELNIVRRKSDVIGVARIGHMVGAGEAKQRAIERYGDEVREPRRCRGALWQPIFESGNLGAHSRGSRRHVERRFHEEAAHSAEVNRREKVFEVDVEHPALAHMRLGIGRHVFGDNEAVRIRVWLVKPVEIGFHLVLQITQQAVWGMNGAHAAGALRDLEGAIAHTFGGLVERPQHAAKPGAEICGDVARGLEWLTVNAERWWVVFGRLGILRHEASRPSYLTHPAGVPVWVKKDICGP